MKMIYHLKSRKKKSPIKYFVIGFIILLFIFNFFKLNPFSSITRKISYPVIKTGSMIASPFSGVSGYFKLKRDLERKIQSLEGEIEGMKSDILENEFLREENKTLKEGFGRNEDEEKGVLAVVLKRPPDSPYDTFVIDVNNEKVSVGQTAYISNVPVGEVVEVNSKTSLIKLFSSSGTIKKVMIGGVVETEAVGHGGGRFTATILQDSEVEVGDAVTLVGSKQYILGVIESVEEDETKTLKLIRFNIPFSLNTTRFIEIR